jgi:hypothetical protein
LVAVNAVPKTFVVDAESGTLVQTLDKDVDSIPLGTDFRNVISAGKKRGRRSYISPLSDLPAEALAQRFACRLSVGEAAGVSPGDSESVGADVNSLERNLAAGIAIKSMSDVPFMPSRFAMFLFDLGARSPELDSPSMEWSAR